MNYRQWKKNYKKKHGCNPPLEVDKRKQAKVMRKALKQIDLPSIVDMVKTIANGLANAFKIIGTIANGLANAFKIIGEAFTNFANSLEVK